MSKRSFESETAWDSKASGTQDAEVMFQFDPRDTKTREEARPLDMIPQAVLSSGIICD